MRISTQHIIAALILLVPALGGCTATIRVGHTIEEGSSMVTVDPIVGRNNSEAQRQAAPRQLPANPEQANSAYVGRRGIGYHIPFPK